LFSLIKRSIGVYITKLKATLTHAHEKEFGMSKDTLEFIGMIGYLIVSYLFGFIFIIFKVTLIVLILFGAFNSMQSAPFQFIHDAQEFTSLANNQFIGSGLLNWISLNWFQLTMMIILFKIIGISQIVSKTEQTSHHAAYSSTAITNYLQINPISQEHLDTLEEKGEVSLIYIFKDALMQRFVTWFSGMVILPNDVIPE